MSGGAAAGGRLRAIGPGLWMLAAVCAQAALQVPYVVLVPGERTNLFTVMLTLLPVLFLLPRRSASPRADWLPWALLGAGFICLGALSPEPRPALLRALAFVVPALAGLACGRVLGGVGRIWLFRILAGCFAAVVAAGLLEGQRQEVLGLHHHALTGVLVLLSAGPIWLAWSLEGWRRWANLVLLALGYALCFLAGSRFLVLLPAVLLPVLLLLRRLRLRHALGLTVLALSAGWLFFALNPGKVPRYANYESTFYRLEGIPASLEILRQHPLTGIGLRSPRAELLREYEPRFGMVDKATFLDVVGRNVTADNLYLSLPVGVGIPLALLYFALLGRELWRMAGRARRGTLGRAEQWALLLPITASLIHFGIYDGLFYPQVCWFFHLLIGAGGGEETAKEGVHGN